MHQISYSGVCLLPKCALNFLCVFCFKQLLTVENLTAWNMASIHLPPMQHIMEQRFFMNVTLTLNWMDMDEDFALKMVPGRLTLHSARVSPKT